VLVTKREKRACRSCEDLGVVSAPLPPRIIEKCLASDRIVIETVVSKYCNHTPLHRQSMILERDLGLEISRATLDGWVLNVGELLIPMVAAMTRELISGTYIQADETPVDVQTCDPFPDISILSMRFFVLLYIPPSTMVPCSTFEPVINRPPSLSDSMTFCTALLSCTSGK
jgi:Transposase IS66 family